MTEATRAGQQSSIVSSRSFAHPRPVIPQKRKRVLDEDTYVACLEKIISRDFFPDLAKLQAQKEYLDALDANDLEQMNAVKMKFTPRGSETPKPTQKTKTHRNDLDEEEFADMPKDDELRKLSLDKFCASYTSEDNDSFDDLVEKAKDKLLEKYEWAQQAALQADKKLAIDYDKEKAQGRYYENKTWKFSVKSALMYHPEGLQLTAKELLERSKQKSIQVKHSNTRFDSGDPYPNGTPSSTSTTRTRTLQGIVPPPPSQNGSETPQVNGYKFAVTPKYEPGKDVEPIMTWGEIEGTPFRLDAGDMKDAPGPVFNIPETNAREELALKLAASMKKRRKIQSSNSSTPRSRSRRTTPRSGTPSSLNSALKASYTKTPSGSRKTPRITPRSTPMNTPRSSQTPISTRSGNSTPKLYSQTETTSNLTDDLL